MKYLNKLKKHPLWVYTLCFALCFGLVFGPFFLTHKTFIYQGDSSMQHYPSFLYYGEQLRRAFASFFVGKGFQFPQWEYSIGLGVDVFSTLSYYIIGEPLSLLSALFPASLAPYGYSLMIALRLYLAGLAFCAFLKERDCAPLPGALAAVAYVFSGYGLRPAIFHSAFSIPMIDLPLLLLGVERLYKKKDPKLFVLAVFHSAVSSFYFFYMLVILVVLYAFLRYFFLFWGQPLRCLGGWVLRFFLWALAGTALAAPILLPCLNSMLQSERLLSVEQDLLLYSKAYFTHYAAGLVSVYEYHYFYVALSGPVLVFALLALTAPKGKFREEKLCMAVLLFFTLVPFFGSMFNAFSYVTNRWIWAFIAGICFCFARGFSLLGQLGRRQLGMTGGLLILLTGLCLLPSPIKITTWCQLAFLWASYLLVAAYSRREKLRTWLPGAVSFLAAAGVLVTGTSLFWPNEAGNYTAYMSRTQANAQRLGVVEPLMEQVVEDPNYRTDSSPTQPYNRALLSGHGTMSYYYSMIDPGTTQFQGAMYYNRSCGQQYYGPRWQSMMMSLLGVRYYAIEAGKTHELPYGFTTQAAAQDGYEIYENEYALPLVTVYDGVASLQEAESPFALQQLMLQAAVTEDETTLPQAQTDLTVEELPFIWRQETSQNARVEEGMIRVEKDQGHVDLEFAPIKGQELCVVFDGLESNMADPKKGMIAFFAGCGKTTNVLNAARPVNRFYCGYKNFLVSVGYQPEEQNVIRLKFNWEGEYRFDSMKIYAVDPSFLEETTLRLRESGVQDILRETNRISFSTRRESPGMAFISIPYNENWSVTIDGEKAILRNIQCGLCGVEIPAGDHQVVMTYRCRPFWLGAAISGATATLLLVLWAWRKVIKRRNSGIDHRERPSRSYP